jgi:hypothetical protein
MLAAIEFHDQLMFQANEIDNVRPHRMLAAESEAFQLLVPNLRPDKFLRVGHVLS